MFYTKSTLKFKSLHPTGKRLTWHLTFSESYWKSGIYVIWHQGANLVRYGNCMTQSQAVKTFFQWTCVLGWRQSEKVFWSFKYHPINKATHPLKFILKPLNSKRPLPLDLTICMQQLVSWPTVWEKSHHTLDTLVCSLLVVVLTALNCVKQTFSFFWHTLNRTVRQVTW